MCSSTGMVQGGVDASLTRLAEEITELAGHISAATCRWLSLVAEFDAREGHLQWGFYSCAEWLAWCCSVSPATAREQVRVARCLRELPLAHVAFSRGELSYSKVRALSRIATLENESELVVLARHATAAQLERVVRGYRRSVAVSLAAANEAHDERYLSCSWDEHGCLVVRGRLGAEEGAVFMRALEEGRDALRNRARTPDGQSDVSAETETAVEKPAPREEMGVSNADAIALMAETLLAHGPGERPGGERTQLVVHVDADTLPEDDAQGACHIEDGPGLHPETARRLGCDASLVRIIERDGRPLSVGRKQRTIPPALRRALKARDHGCRFPGCNRHRGTHGHHIQHWSKGGETKLSNLVQLCHRHHRLVHEGGYRVEPDGARLRFLRPDGRPIPNTPRPPHGHETRLRSLNHSQGATIDAETCVPLSRGDRIDYGHAVEGLLHNDGLLGLHRRPRPPPA